MASNGSGGEASFRVSFRFWFRLGKKGVVMVQGREIPTPVRAESDLYFGPFHLEQAKRLWRGNQLVGVRPQPLAVLRYLAERQGQLVTGEELLKLLWPGIYVTKTVLRVCVRELRQALGEDRATPQFIETVGRQGTDSSAQSALSCQHSALSQ
jgi:DNA-binding winged helix-turn-helix (wHTH) protein